MIKNGIQIYDEMGRWLNLKKHTKFGKVFFWFGLLFFMSGVAFNQRLGVITEGPEILSTFSIPLIILGIILIVISNFFRNKNSN